MANVATITRVTKMQREGSHEMNSSKFLKKNHSTHIKWERDSKKKALELAKKYGFGNLSAYLRYLASEGYAEMHVMLMEIHKKLMEGQKSMVKEYTHELEERMLSSEKNQESQELMEEEILVEK